MHGCDDQRVVPVQAGHREDEAGVDGELPGELLRAEVAGLGAVAAEDEGTVRVHLRADDGLRSGTDQTDGRRVRAQDLVEVGPAEPLGQRGAADVAGAHEEQVNSGSRRCSGTERVCGRGAEQSQVALPTTVMPSAPAGQAPDAGPSFGSFCPRRIAARDRPAPRNEA